MPRRARRGAGWAMAGVREARCLRAISGPSGSRRCRAMCQHFLSVVKTSTPQHWYTDVGDWTLILSFK